MLRLRSRFPRRRSDDFLAYVERKDFGEDDALKKAFLVYVYEGHSDEEALRLLNRDLAVPLTDTDRALNRWASL
jgi:hypothetical protein